ncbi:hypothetical protein MLD38_021946 [Melastoma candidum]|uniref:Uncharacterized protein n=1 Tax=Melastoma candidum TaxID=119954 RepID=A0ACB9QGV4_9MYRT|nr:hypothetical protein MLD38_021946 [Melastoma candidum]
MDDPFLPPSSSPGRITGRLVREVSSESSGLFSCTGSPGVPPGAFSSSPDICHISPQKLGYSVELSLDACLASSRTNEKNQNPTVSFSSTCQTFSMPASPESSFELPPPPMREHDGMTDVFRQSTAGSTCTSTVDTNGLVGDGDSEEDDDSKFGELQEVLKDYKNQRKELAKARKLIEELKRENQLLTRECQEACKSRKDLQDELMRKSMHVGSLAFAIEGQVKEKSKWFSSLRDLTRKLKITKMEQIKLSEEALAYRKCIADFSAMSATIQATVNQQIESYGDLKVNFLEAARQKKDLYNKVLELKGNIRVFCRCRPLNAQEIAAGATIALDFENEGELTIRSNGACKRTFKFDAVFDPQSDQVDVFRETAPLAASVLDGYNVCIFAYGQTGTGKTYTMEGTDEARGVNYRTLQEFFRIVEERKKILHYDISVSVLEVYNEQIRDLLSAGSPAGLPAKRLEIRQAGEGMLNVPGLVEARVNNMNEVWEVLHTGNNARAVGSTNANEHSSRSHCLHCVMVRGENLLNGECLRSKLWLVDLAGSERIAKTDVQGERLKETQYINRSLSALGDVISALATKSPHIPFRNSKLTHLLQDSLGGDSKALMFVQISPNENDMSETICSLNFASRVKGVELGPAKKQLDAAEFSKYKQMVERTKLEVKSKDVQIRKMEETMASLDSKVRDKDLKNRSLQEKVKELESQLLVERKLARQHVDTKIAEQQQQLKQHGDQNAEIRPPLATCQIIRPCKDSLDTGFSKDRTRVKVCNAPPAAPSDDFFDSIEKENNPFLLEEPLIPIEIGKASICETVQPIPAFHGLRRESTVALPIPRRTGRASISAPPRQMPVIRALRRNSLIPLPVVPSLERPPRTLSPLRECNPETRECQQGYEAYNLPQKVPCESPKATRSGNKKMNSALRRSSSKKMHGKSPMQQQMRKGGIIVGTEKVRVSIGSRGRTAHRVFLGTNRVARMKDGQNKLSQKEKERGWNSSTAGKTVI